MNVRNGSEKLSWKAEESREAAAGAPVRRMTFGVGMLSKSALHYLLLLVAEWAARVPLC